MSPWRKYSYWLLFQFFLWLLIVFSSLFCPIFHPCYEYRSDSFGAFCFRSSSKILTATVCDTLSMLPWLRCPDLLHGQTELQRSSLRLQPFILWSCLLFSQQLERSNLSKLSLWLLQCPSAFSCSFSKTKSFSLFHLRDCIDPPSDLLSTPSSSGPNHSAPHGHHTWLAIEFFFSHVSHVCVCVVLWSLQPTALLHPLTIFKHLLGTRSQPSS